MAQPSLEETCEAYLRDRHTVLWGEAFEILTTNGRAEAARWLARQVRGVQEYIEMGQIR